MSRTMQDFHTIAQLGIHAFSETDVRHSRSFDISRDALDLYLARLQHEKPEEWWAIMCKRFKWQLTTTALLCSIPEMLDFGPYAYRILPNDTTEFCFRHKEGRANAAFLFSNMDIGVVMGS